MLGRLILVVINDLSKFKIYLIVYDSLSFTYKYIMIRSYNQFSNAFIKLILIITMAIVIK